MISFATAFGIAILFSAMFTSLLVHSIHLNVPIINLVLLGSYVTGISTLSIKGYLMFKRP